MIKIAIILVANKCPKEEMTVEQWHIDHIFIDLRGRVFRDLNRWFVSRRGASLDPGTDVTNKSMLLFYHPKRLESLVGMVGIVGAIRLSGDLHSRK
jgi:hypothetical protein